MAAAPFAPVATAELELERRLELRSPLGRRLGDYARARVLVRLHGRPLGLLEVELDRARDADALAAHAWRTLRGEIAEHLHSDGLPPAQSLTADGLHAREPPRTLGRTGPRPSPPASVSTKLGPLEYRP